MAIVNQTEREQKQIGIIEREIKRAFKTTGGIRGDMEFYKDSDGNIKMILENNLGGFSMNMADIVSKSEFGQLISSGEVPGLFDWRSNTYIKDYSFVIFKI